MTTSSEGGSMSNVQKPLAAPAMPSDEDVEKRVYRRLPKTYPVEVIKLDFPMPKEGVKTRCCDISMGGVCVESGEIPFEVGDPCQLKILIPLLNKYSPGFFKVYENDAEQYFIALSELAWIKPAGGQFLVGFKFVNVHSDQQKALAKLIERAFAQT